MTWVWVSIGSNIDRAAMVRAAVRDLRTQFGELVISPVYETSAVGFTGAPFYNLVVGFATTLRPGELHTRLRAIEAAHGRRRDQSGLSDRTLDLDLLTFGDQVTDEGGKALPRDEILQYAFVMKPLADVAPDEIHPQTGISYAQHWQSFVAGAETLHRIADDVLGTLGGQA